MKTPAEQPAVMHRVALSPRRAGRDAIFFLHGWGGNKETFDAARDARSLREHSLLAIDLLGHGETPAPEDMPCHLVTQARMTGSLIGSYIKEYNLRTAHIVGHSMGGAVGLLTTRELVRVGHPATLISVEGNLVPADTSENARKLAAMSPAQFRTIGRTAVRVKLLTSWDENERRWSKSWDQADPNALYEGLRSVIGWSDDNKLMGIFEDLPSKAYVYGAQSAGKIETVLPQLPPGMAYPVENAGHFPMWDNPTEFYDTIGHLVNDVL